MTPLRTCPVDRATPSLGLRHGQAPNARPPAQKLLQPLVDLVNVAAPTAIRCCCVGVSQLERAALEVSQIVWYGGVSVAFQFAFQEQGKEWHPA